MSARTPRPAARILLVDGENRVLMFRFTPDDRPPLWCTPGGAVDPGESYADTSLFQIVEGLRYMFPRRMKTLEPEYPNLNRIHDQVAELPGIKAYLNSDRRIAFNTDGIFRAYPELDAA